MNVNNFALIEDTLEFQHDIFYHVQIIKRRKEHPSQSSNAIVIKQYAIGSIEKWEKLKPEIKALCDCFNARAYINLNKKSYKLTNIKTLGLLADCLEAGRCGAYAFWSAASRFNAPGNQKMWVIDIDATPSECEIIKEKVLAEINELRPIGNKLVITVPTKNGVHLITHPFDLSQFNMTEISNQVDIHKNNPTILYV